MLTSDVELILTRAVVTECRSKIVKL